MKILFLHKRFLFPQNTGGRIRTLNVVRHLAKWHEVTYLCNEEPEDKPYRSDMESLGVRLETSPWLENPRWSLKFYGEVGRNVFSQYPLNVDKDYDPGLRRRAEELLEQDSYDLVICDFVQMARNAIELNVPAKLLFQHNVEAELLERRAKMDCSFLRRHFMNHQAAKMRRFESDAGRAFDRVIAVSQRDATVFADMYNWNHVDVIDTAVDTEFFQPINDPPMVPGRVVFVGSMDWLPNVDAVQWFVRDIWPAIRKEMPHATFQVVGRNPPSELSGLSSHHGVDVTGTVEDVRPYLAGAEVVVVPLRIGSGTRLKIYEAMAMKKAVISTPLGAEGLPLQDGSEILLPREVDQFAAAVVRVLGMPNLRERLAANSQSLVLERFRAEVVARQFEAICIDTYQRSATPKDGTIQERGSVQV